jgi:hypothetical protein
LYQTVGGIVAILLLLKLTGGIAMRQGLSTDWTKVDGYCHLEKSNHYAKMISMAALLLVENGWGNTSTQG